MATFYATVRAAAAGAFPVVHRFAPIPVVGPEETPESGVRYAHTTTNIVVAVQAATRREAKAVLRAAGVGRIARIRAAIPEGGFAVVEARRSFHRRQAHCICNAIEYASPCTCGAY